MKTLAKIGGAILLLSIVAFAGSIGKLIGRSTADRFFEGKKESELAQILLKTANELNANLPMIVDKETRLDNTIGLNKRLQYNYTLVNYTAVSIAPRVLHETFVSTFKNRVCTNEKMKFSFNNDVALSYAYYGNDGILITTINVTPEECGY